MNWEIEVATIISGSNDADVLLSTRGDDIVTADAGDDRIEASDGHDIIDGGEGNDELSFRLSNGSRFAPPPANDQDIVLTVTNAAVRGASGRIDTTYSKVETISISTAAGPSPSTSIGSLTVDAQTYSGRLIVDYATTQLFRTLDVKGSSGNDVITLSTGHSAIVDGGGGRDTLQHLNFQGSISFFSGDQTSGVSGYLAGGYSVTFRNVEVVRLSATNIDATSLAISGLILADMAGSNTYFGSVSGDRFEGLSSSVAGDDRWTGNGGSDVFAFTYRGPDAGSDTITDFDTDDSLSFAWTGSSPLVLAFIGNAQFTGVAGQYRLQFANGQTVVLLDVDGDSVADNRVVMENGDIRLGQTMPGSNVLRMVVQPSIVGTAGNDYLITTKGADTVAGLDGADFIEGSEGTDLIDGGAGRDTVNFGLAYSDWFSSAPGPRTITIQNDRIFDDIGRIDTHFSNVEQITISESGDSSVVLGPLTVDGRSTNIDVLLSYGKGFTALLGSGNDYVAAGFFNASVNGGMGQDGVQVAALGTHMVLTGDTQNAVVTSVSGTLTRTVTLISIERVTLFGGNMDSSNSSIPTRFVDTSSRQTATGSRQNDIFVVADNNRYQGVDDMWRGGGGADVYDFTYALGGIDGKHILDFDADDRLDFGFAEDKNPLPAFVTDGIFTGRAGEYRTRIDGAKTLIEADYNGDRIVDRTLTIENGAFVLGETAPGSNSLVLRSSLASDTADTLAGTSGGETIDGRGGADRIDLSQGGDDRALGGDGDDGIFFGAAFTAADFVDGGAGANDQLALQGDYSAGVALGAAQVVNTEVVVLLPGFSYNLTTRDDLVAAGEALTVYAAQLAAGDVFGFDGRAESDGAFSVYGGQGADTIRTGAGNDFIAFGPGGFDPLRDLVDGGAGDDRLVLDGDFALTLSGTSLIGIETIELARGPAAAPNGFTITLADSFAARSTPRMITGSAVATTLIIDASAETAAPLTLIGGSAGDTLTGGGGADVLGGGLGGDRLTGGAGDDVFAYGSAAESTGPGFDRLDFDPASDRIDLPVAITSFNPVRSVGTLSTAAFDAGMTALAASLAASGAMIVEGGRGDLSGQAFLVVDGNGVAGYQPGEDYVFQIPVSIAAIPLTAFI